MNSLIFAVAKNEVIEKTIREELKRKNTVYLFMTSNSSNNFEELFPEIMIIKTEGDRISYIVVKEENRIPKVFFNKVIIPSSKIKDIWNFGELFAIASDLKFNVIIWQDSKGNKKIIKNTINFRLQMLVERLLTVMMMSAARCVLFFEKNMLGYRY